MKRITAKLQLPQGRIMALVGLTVLLFTLALGVVLWRFGVAASLDRTAVTKSQAQVFAHEARVALAQEGGLADAYASDKASVDLRALKVARLDLGTALSGIERIAHGQDRVVVLSIRSASSRPV